LLDCFCELYYFKTITMFKALISSTVMLLTFCSSFAQESHWKLVAIKTSILQLAPLTRATKDLPLDNHQLRNVSWSGQVDNRELKINFDILFENVPAMIPASNTFINPDFKINAGGHTPFAEYIIVWGTADLETVSGFQQKDSYGLAAECVSPTTSRKKTLH
jgi:hypothetical protein